MCNMDFFRPFLLYKKDMIALNRSPEFKSANPKPSTADLYKLGKGPQGNATH